MVSHLQEQRVLGIGYQQSNFNEAVEGVLALHPVTFWSSLDHKQRNPLLGCGLSA